MTLGEKMKACRQRAGMSQEKVAELIGVSRQAVGKWESNQSVPNTENLFRLAEILGTTVDSLLGSEEKDKMEEEKKIALKKQMQKRNLLLALLIALGYLVIYLAGRILWCDWSQSNLFGWLFTARPSGEHSYLYGWLLSSRLFWFAMAITGIPALFGKYSFSFTTFIGFVVGLTAGMIFGPYPAGAAIGHSHYGWAIWGVAYLFSIFAGVIIERCKKRSDRKPVDEQKK